MVNIWLAADLHFGHTNLVDGFPSRPEGGRGPRGHFASVEEHDEAIIANWNATVKPGDKAYILGDCAMSARSIPLLRRLNGHKRGVLGNHDKGQTKEYIGIFDSITGAKCLDGMVLTHIPIHPMCLNRRSMRANVHGHMHENSVPDPRYVCVSLEQIGYKPIHLDAVKDMFGGLLSPVDIL